MRTFKLALTVLSSLLAVLYLFSPKILEIYGVAAEWQGPITGLCLVGWIGTVALETWKRWPTKQSAPGDAPPSA